MARIHKITASRYIKIVNVDDWKDGKPYKNQHDPNRYGLGKVHREKEEWGSAITKNDVPTDNIDCDPIRLPNG